ncbi:HMG domain-containing protein 4-like isoform X1 [Asterias rubens]|uniref:HMG domain-containing protein 4-like isoform X1 n=1 Tax=Asterias rubens TaxID=7604 RepID=UPI0014558871|nr:HMG domain-containing protein 4-like isoform X1 [Asterias rubens]
MSSRSRKRKRTSSVEFDQDNISQEDVIYDEEEPTQEEPQSSRPSRNRRKSAKLTEAEETMKTPTSTEPQKLGVISLHHKKGGKKDSGDSWTITSSSKPSRKSSSVTSQDKEEDEEVEEAQLLHVVGKGNRPQTIKIKPLHKPQPAVHEDSSTEKQSTSRHAKKSRQSALPPISIHEDSNVSVKEEQGIKLKLILSPKDKGKSNDFETAKKESRPSRDKQSKAAKGKVEKVKKTFEEALAAAETKRIPQTKKRKRDDAESEETSGVSESSKGNKKRKTSEIEKVSKRVSKAEETNKSTPKTTTKSVKKAESSKKNIIKDLPKSASKSTNKPLQVKVESKTKLPVKDESKTKLPVKDESKTKSTMKSPSSSISKTPDTAKDDDKSKKKKSKSSKIATSHSNLNLLSMDESLEELVIDETKSETPATKIKSSKNKPEKKKKKLTDSDTFSAHKSKKHKSKELKKHKAKFITTGTKKPNRNVGLDPVTASHMFGQFESGPSLMHGSLDLKSPSTAIDDESFFMAGHEATSPGFASDLMGLPGLGDLGLFGKTKKVAKKSSKKGDKDKKKKKKKEKLKKGAKAENGVTKEKKPLSAYMLWCAHTRPRVVAQNPGLDFSGISKTMGTLWHQLPEKEKLFWYSKQRMQIVKHKNVPSLSKQKLRRSSSSGKGSRSPRGSPVRHFSLRTEPIDCAAHLKLLGESLSLVGDRLQNHVGQVEVHGSLSVLLDSTLCALAPLMSLTSQVPELNSIPKETLGSTLDNIAYIMPGLG